MGSVSEEKSPCSWQSRACVSTARSAGLVYGCIVIAFDYYVTRTNPLMMTIRNSRRELTMLTGKSKMNKQLQINWLLEID
jgi:hypothetical protein